MNEITNQIEDSLHRLQAEVFYLIKIKMVQNLKGIGCKNKDIYFEKTQSLPRIISKK